MQEYINRYPTKYYTDLNIAFSKHPTSNDVTVKTNEDAIKQGLKNLILLNSSEKPFHPEIGGNIYRMLFENFNEIGTDEILRDIIIALVNRHEPRIDLTEVTVDFLYDNNAVAISLRYVIITSLIESTTQIFLKVAR